MFEKTGYNSHMIVLHILVKNVRCHKTPKIVVEKQHNGR